MNAPFITVTRTPIRPGQRERAIELANEIGRVVREHEPQVLGFYCFLDIDRTHTITVQVHPDAESMRTHVRLVAEHIARAGDPLALEQSTMDSLGDAPAEYRQWREHFGAAGRDFPSPAAVVDRLNRAGAAGGPPEPFLWIASIPIRKGGADAQERSARAVERVVREQEPQLLGFYIYLDEPRENVVVVQVHPSPESMATHMHAIADSIARADETLDLEHGTYVTVGTPPAYVLTWLNRNGFPHHAFPTPVVAITRRHAPLVGASA